MFKRAFSAVMLILLLTSMLTLAFDIQPIKAERTIIVPDDYSTIQQAVDAAGSGDTVYVRAGTYYERVVVAKELSLVGEDRATTIIDGSSAARAVSIADYVTVAGFTIRGNVYWVGIAIGGRYCNVSGNNVVNCYQGIALGPYGDNVITGNEATDNSYAIYLSASSNNDVSRNTVVNNDYGIYASASDRNRIVENNVSANKWLGIDLSGGSGKNVLARNNIANDGIGIMIDSSYSDPRNYNSVVENRIANNSGDGIQVYYSGHNNIVGNDITVNGRGILFYGSSSSSNSLIGNNLTYNQKGIAVAFGSIQNRIYHNNFIYNTKQVQDDNANFSVNVWDDGYPSGGNYWSDYGGTDANHDGIGDFPYDVSYDEKDNYPLIDPTNYVYPWGDDDSDGVLNYLDIPSLTISTWQKSARILGFDWSLAYSTSEGPADYGQLSTIYKSWGIETLEIQRHMDFAVLDFGGLREALTWLRANVPYLITQDFANSLMEHMCSDGHFRLLLFAHYDLDTEETMQYLLRTAKLITSPDLRSCLTAFSYWCKMFDVEIYQLEGVDSVRGYLQFDWTDIVHAVEAAKLGIGDLSALAGTVVEVVTMTFLVLGGVTVAPELMLAYVAKVLVKTFKFVLDFAKLARPQYYGKTLDWIKTGLTIVDPPGEKLVLELRDPISGTLLLGYNSTSGADVGAFPYGICVSEDDSALMILARDSANYNLTVARNSTGSSLPYVLIVWDCAKNKTVTTGGFLESEQETSSNIRIESDVLTMSYLQVHANFSTLTPNVGEQVEVNINVTDNTGSPIDDLTVALCLNNAQAFTQDLGEGRYQTHIDTSGMRGFYNITIYSVNPPSGFLQGMSCYPLMVGTSDMVITNSTLAKTVLGQGLSTTTNLTVENAGNIVEPFVLSLYANSTCILKQGISGLASGNSTTLQLMLSTSTLDIGKYSITAGIDPLPGEISVLNNNRTVGWMTISLMGDINGDFIVDIYDAILLSNGFNDVPASPHWNPNTDINNDNIVDIYDAIILAMHFEESWT